VPGIVLIVIVVALVVLAVIVGRAIDRRRDWRDPRMGGTRRARVRRPRGLPPHDDPPESPLT
jgi:hypothetical protein